MTVPIPVPVLLIIFNLISWFLQHTLYLQHTLRDTLNTLMYTWNLEPLEYFHTHQMVLATYSIVRATLNSEEVNQECVSRYIN